MTGIVPSIANNLERKHLIQTWIRGLMGGDMYLKHTALLAILAVSFSSVPAFAEGNPTPSKAGAPSTSKTSPTTVSPFAGIEGADGLYDNAAHPRHPMISLMGFLPLYGLGIGASGRFTLPLLADGFIDNLNDSVELELGADLAFATGVTLGFGYSYVDLTIPVEGRWTFHFTSALAAYGKLALSYEIIPYTSSSIVSNTLSFNLAIGGLYKLGEKFFLRGELGYRGLKVGVGLEF